MPFGLPCIYDGKRLFERSEIKGRSKLRKTLSSIEYSDYIISTPSVKGSSKLIIYSYLKVNQNIKFYFHRFTINLCYCIFRPICTCTSESRTNCGPHCTSIWPAINLVQSYITVVARFWFWALTKSCRSSSAYERKQPSVYSM